MGRGVKIHRQFNEFSRPKIIVFLLLVLLAISISVPSLARYRNFVNLEAMFSESETWDGTVATSYKSGTGTPDDPYIISNAKEFAYFAEQLRDTNYLDTYFKLSNNIVINNGTFSYDAQNIMYTLEDKTFYIKEYSTEVYEDNTFNGNIISNINMFESISNFSGHLDGDFFTIYGLYITNSTGNLALFKELNGNVSNLYFNNAFIYGGANTSVLASVSNGSTISNVSVNGIVVGKDTNNDEVIYTTLSDISKSKGWFSNLNFNIDMPSISNTTPTKYIVTGSIASSGSGISFTIGGETASAGEFTRELDGSATSIAVSASGFRNSTITVTNLNVEVHYNYGVTSGLVGKAIDTNLNNVINKADIYGTNSAGLVGIASDITLENAYNTGNINGSNNASGLISRVTNSSAVIIRKTYNDGTLSGANTNLIDTILSNDSIVIGETFNNKSYNSTFNYVDGNVSVNTLYDVNSTGVKNGSVTGNINVVTSAQYTETLFKDTLNYSEYIDSDDMKSNPDNIWVYEFVGLPILFMDEYNNPVASLNVGVYSWNDVNYDVVTKKFTTSMAFKVISLDAATSFKGVYYYLYEGTKALSNQNMKAITDWVSYDDVVSLDKEGNYIIYVKIIMPDDRVYYINSECLLFDLFGPDINVSYSKYSWNELKSSLNSQYINDEVTLSAQVTDKYSLVDSTEYYISDVLLTEEELENISEWTTYTDGILINKKGPNVINIKSMDSNGHVSYINTDYIIYGGYSETLSSGEIGNKVDTLYVTDRSKVTYEFSFNDPFSYKEGYTNNIVTSIKLPVGTKLYFKDIILNKIYTYSVTNSEEDYGYALNGYASYPLNQFIEVGNIDNITFDDKDYTNTETKNSLLTIDFSGANIESDIVFNAYLELIDTDATVVLSTLRDSFKNTHIISNLYSNLVINNNSVIYGINYDSNSTTEIDFEYNLSPLVKDGNVVIDSIYDDMSSGIAIKMVDKDGKLIDRKYLSNMEFIVDDIKYGANSDGIVRIKLSDVHQYSGKLKIVTYENDLALENGSYSLVIVPYMAYDGYFCTDYSSSVISIPVVSEYEEIYDYDFNVIIPSEYKILDSKNNSVDIPIKVLSSNQFKDSNIRVSLYKKTDLTSLNQNYTEVDLGSYSSTQLDLAEGNSYYVTNNSFNINLDLSKMDMTGYELRFELYDGSKRIEIVKKKFIIK